MNTAPQTADLSPDWLDNAAAPALTTANSLSVGGSATWYPANYWTYGYTEPRKIRLKLSEVEKLRAAARKDKALKEVLRKFTGHIEIEVDFE